LCNEIALSSKQQNLHIKSKKTKVSLSLSFLTSGFITLNGFCNISKSVTFSFITFSFSASTGFSSLNKTFYPLTPIIPKKLPSAIAAP
jgi:hypothetical protein